MSLYTGPAIPTTYDPQWVFFTNLSPAQILAFQSFPQDLVQYAAQRRWLASLTGTSITFTPSGSLTPVTIPLTTDGDSQRNLIGMRQAVDDGLVSTVAFVADSNLVVNLAPADAKTVYQAVMTFVQQLFSAQAQLVAGINGGTVTTRAQIDTALAAVAPNSPSATQPSPT